MTTQGDSIQAPLVSRAARRAAGKAQRKKVARSDHAECRRNPDIDAIDLLVAQDENRVESLVPIRHGRMSQSSFRFYRGAAAIMAADLAALPRTSGLDVQLCGDAHIGNFGLFYSADRRLVFDINDFDETLVGPFDYDVKRLAASVFIAARAEGAKRKKARKLAQGSVEAYRDAMGYLADMDPLELHYLRIEIDQIDTEGLLSNRHRRDLEKLVAKAATKTRFRAFGKLADMSGGVPYLVEAPPLIVRIPDDEFSLELDFVQRAIDEYGKSMSDESRHLLGSNYHLVDVVAKVVGVGSVGTRCLIALLVSPDGDPLILQIKEASESVFERWLGASPTESGGERVVRGQRRIQASSDIFLGWTRVEREGESSDFYVRQLWDGKASPAVDTMKPSDLDTYGKACGAALALAHARVGDAASMSGYMGRNSDKFPEAISRFAEGYYELNEADAAEHLARIADGRIKVINDV